MPSSKASLSYGVARSPAFAATARRCKASRPPIGLGLALAALLSVILWSAVGLGAQLLIAEAAKLAVALAVAC